MPVRETAQTELLIATGFQCTQENRLRRRAPTNTVPWDIPFVHGPLTLPTHGQSWPLIGGLGHIILRSLGGIPIALGQFPYGNAGIWDLQILSGTANWDFAQVYYTPPMTQPTILTILSSDFLHS